MYAYSYLSYYTNVMHYHLVSTRAVKRSQMLEAEAKHKSLKLNKNHVDFSF